MPGERTPQEIVNDLLIASPCDVPWSAMDGDDRVRHCGQCDRQVYNIARLSAEEVVALLQASDRPPCLQLWRRADGTVLTADCPIGQRRLRARRRQRLLVAAAFTGLLAGTGAWYLHHRAETLGRCSPAVRLGGAPHFSGAIVDTGVAPPLDPPQVKTRPEGRPHPLMGKVAVRAQPPKAEPDAHGVK